MRLREREKERERVERDLLRVLERPHSCTIHNVQSFVHIYFVVFLALYECLVGELQCLQRKRGARMDGAVRGGGDKVKL